MTNNKNKIVVLGAGVTGISAVEFFYSPSNQVWLIESDSNKDLHHLQDSYSELQILKGPLINYIDLIKEADSVVVSPGIDINSNPQLGLLLLKRGFISDIEIFANSTTKPVIGITGSNGKSTVTKLCAEILNTHGLKASYGGNYGRAALDLLKDKDADIFILELSSFQLDLSPKIKLDAATILNISPDHLDRYESYQEYRESKFSLIPKSRNIILNSKDSELNNCIRNYAGSSAITSYGSNSDDMYFDNSGNLLINGQLILAEADLGVIGEHNKTNILAALALASKFVKLEQVLVYQVITKFKTLPHRCEVVSKSSNIMWVNDSKATNVGATVSALKGLKNAITGKWIIILGGDSKGADLSLLKDTVVKSCKSVITIGKDKEQLNNLFRSLLPVKTVSSLSEAVDLSNTLAIPGDGVLLSPACASLDMFDNFAHRGDIFKKLVNELVTTTVA